MLLEQNNQCLICNRSLLNERVCIDHCHDKGHVRGLLCNSCNSVLGFAYDNINILKNAIKYLQNNK